MGEGVVQGFKNLYVQTEDKFHLILDKSHPSYMDLPGISVIIGGLWVANLYYWGCNQYIIQRALAAKSVSEAQKGMLFYQVAYSIAGCHSGHCGFCFECSIGKIR